MDQNYFVEPEFPIYFLDCKDSFGHLSVKEKQYAHALIKAGWNGALIDLIQCSPESPGLFILAQKIFEKQSSVEIEELIKSLGFDDSDGKNFLNYFTLIYDNLGNYRSFGDSKFIPRIDKGKFEKIIISTQAYHNDNIVKEVFEHVKEAVYSLNERNKQFGLGENGISTYYSYNCSEEDAKLVQEFLDKNNFSAYNTRVFKAIHNGVVSYEVRQASSNSGLSKKLIGPAGENVHVNLTNGDYSDLMGLMVSELHKAKQLSLNDNENHMIEFYINSFETGNIDSHKEGSRWWIKDKGPVVETYIGFIESYRDPIGVRGEFEAFIAIVNKEMTVKFDNLVKAAPEILAELPWSKEYEKDKFLQPDFTSLDIINFPNSGMPVGINIPNYDDIRQSEGFKNVSLGNVLTSRFKDPKATFLRNSEKELFVKNAAAAFEVQVGLHELIGHGSGKLFYLNNGEYNFDKHTTKDAITGGQITSWYKDNETWDSVFLDVASPFEECRAESVGLYLCSLPSVLRIFGHSNEAEARDIFYINWLSMVKSGLISMEFYTPAQQKWRQAHCHARFVILQVLLEAGEGLVTVQETTGTDGRPDLEIHLDRTKIETTGRAAIGKFLTLLQHYKSTANKSEGRAFFHRYSILNDHHLHLRDIVIERKSPRAVMVQCVVRDCGSGVEMVEYPSTVHGMIQSFTDRFAGVDGERALEALYHVWKRDQAHFV